MDEHLNTIVGGDCIEGMSGLAAGSVDLAFADPPFNIGYDYDVYDDSLERETYIAWSRTWVAEVYRALKDSGTFWLAIGDEYAAELKLESQEIGFHCRSWVIWYYTFGVNCSKKFSRSHAHLFHFVKDPKKFTFRDGDLDNRIPSARQLVYNDRRANPRGRLPDDTWILRPAGTAGELSADETAWQPDELPPPADADQTWALRPQDLDACFQPDGDTWYFPRVAGTFKERAGFHGCQMPEQILGRIVRTCSVEGDLVLDPFSGSGTTLVVAKKLARRFLGFELSDDYVKFGQKRLESVRVGDRLEGSPEPLLSAPRAAADRNKSKKRRDKQADDAEVRAKERRYGEIQLELTLRGVREAFQKTYNGFSVDRVVADPDRNAKFAVACRAAGLAGDARTWNILLFRLRKAGQLANLETVRRTAVSWEDCDPFLFASEIALQMLLDEDRAESLDEILCDPLLAAEFDMIAARFAPGFKPLEYRWAALKLRKQAKVARSRGAVLAAPSRLGKVTSIDELDLKTLPEQPGVYLLTDDNAKGIYAGEALNLRDRLTAQFGGQKVRKSWIQLSDSIRIQTFLTESSPTEMLAWQSCFVSKYKPKLNFQDLRTSK